MNPQEFAVTMAMDAFRHAMGIPPRNHSLADVIRWMRTVAQVAP